MSQKLISKMLSGKVVYSDSTPTEEKKGPACNVTGPPVFETFGLRSRLTGEQVQPNCRLRSPK